MYQQPYRALPRSTKGRTFSAGVLIALACGVGLLIQLAVLGAIVGPSNPKPTPQPVAVAALPSPFPTPSTTVAQIPTQIPAALQTSTAITSNRMASTLVPVPTNTPIVAATSVSTKAPTTNPQSQDIATITEATRTVWSEPL